MTDSLLEFPCEFPVKVMGRQSEQLRPMIDRIIAQTDMELISVRERPSRSGNYLSLTVTIMATSRETLDDLYLRLTAIDDVMVVL